MYDAETEDYIRDLERLFPGSSKETSSKESMTSEMTNYRGAMWVMRDVELTGGRFEKSSTSLKKTSAVRALSIGKCPVERLA